MVCINQGQSTPDAAGGLAKKAAYEVYANVGQYEQYETSYKH